MIEITLAGFFTFLGSAVFMLGYISNNSLFPESLSLEEERKYIKLMNEGDEETMEEIEFVNPGKEDKRVYIHLPIECEKGWLIRRKK